MLRFFRIAILLSTDNKLACVSLSLILLRLGNAIVEITFCHRETNNLGNDCKAFLQHCITFFFN